MRRAGPGPTHHQPTLYTRPSTARSLATTRTVIEVPSDGFRARICAWRRAGVRNMSAPSGAKVAISGRAVKTSDNSPRFSDNLKQIKRLRERIVPRSGTNTALQAPGQNRNSRQILAVSKSRTQCHPPTFLAARRPSGALRERISFIAGDTASQSTSPLTLNSTSAPRLSETDTSSPCSR